MPDALVVHRLDMATSGLILMARGADMQRAPEPGLRRARSEQALCRRGRRPLDARGRRRLGRDRPAARRRLAEPAAAHHRSASTASPASPAGACWRMTRQAGTHPGRTGAGHRPLAPAARAPAGDRPSDPGRRPVCAAGRRRTRRRACCCMRASCGSRIRRPARRWNFPARRRSNRHSRRPRWTSTRSPDAPSPPPSSSHRSCGARPRPGRAAAHRHAGADRRSVLPGRPAQGHRLRPAEKRRA